MSTCIKVGCRNHISFYIAGRSMVLPQLAKQRFDKAHHTYFGPTSTKELKICCRACYGYNASTLIYSLVI